MIVTIKNPRRVDIFIDSGRHTAKEVRALTGADAVINGGLYNMGNMSPNCHLRVKGVDYASDPYNYVYGYGWPFGSAKLKPVESRNKSTVDNYICDSWMVTDGKPVAKMIYDSAQGGKRGNTAIGVKADGSIVLNVHRDVSAERITPEEMQQEMLDVGCMSAMRLDGGGSSQLSAEGIELPSSVGRRVHNYICIWGEIDSLKKEDDHMVKMALGAGHGFNTAGKRITLKDLDPNLTREWWLNDRICDYIESYLKDYAGYELLRVDDSDDGADDIALIDRVNAANEWGADFYLSIHHNAGINGGKGGGIVAYSYPNSTKGAEWRDALYEALIKETGLKGNRAHGTQTASFYVLKHTNAPAVLLELGFMDSQTDVPIILTEDYARKCARAIVATLASRFGLKQINNEGTATAAPIEPESPTAYAAAACGKAAAKGIFKGNGNGKYGWSESVTRQDLCVILDRLGLL